jgi:hypothetical protein
MVVAAQSARSERAELAREQGVEQMVYVGMDALEEEAAASIWWPAGTPSLTFLAAFVPQVRAHERVHVFLWARGSTDLEVSSSLQGQNYIIDSGAER